jgi:outer membrane protein assembly factor BamB
MPSRRSFLATGGALVAGAFAGCTDSLLAQSPAGTQWSASVPAPTPLSPPVTTNGLLAVGGYRDGRLENGRLTVFDAAGGTRRWEVDLGRMTGLTAGNGRVYVGERGGPRGARARIRAFDAASGEQLWTRGVSNLASALTVANDTLYAANGSPVADFERVDDGFLDAHLGREVPSVVRGRWEDECWFDYREPLRADV